MNESESNPPKDTPKRMSLKSPVSPIQTRNLTMESIEPSPQTEEPTNTLHIVYARYNVFMRKDETDASIVRGYLCVTMSQDLVSFDLRSCIAHSRIQLTRFRISSIIDWV